MKFMWMFAFLVLPLLGIFYASWRIYYLLPIPPVWRFTLIGIGILCVLTIFLNFTRTIDRMPMTLATITYEVGNSALIILLYTIIVFLILDIARFLHMIPTEWMIANGKTALAIFMFLVGTFIYGNINYRNKVRQPVDITTTKQIGEGIKVVFLSDLHLGYHNRRTELARWIDMINAEHPDLVLFGGDIIDISVRPLITENMAEEFHRLTAPAFACLGNHEYYSGEPLAQKFYQEAGIHLLQDSIAEFENICIIGRDDRTNHHRKNLKRVMRGIETDKFTILLDHQPYHLEQAERMGIDFQFSGHTHHGQVWPISWITEALYEDAFGPLQKGNTHYYVSSGMGIWGGKFRIGTQSEYVVLTITPENLDK